MMIQRQNAIANIPLDQQAVDQVHVYADDFTAQLILQSKLAAQRDGDYLVVKRHVEEGYEIVTRQRT